MTPYKNTNTSAIFPIRHSPFRIPVFPAGPSIHLSGYISSSGGPSCATRPLRAYGGPVIRTILDLPSRPHPYVLGLHNKILAPCNKFISDTNGLFETHARPE